jgi:inorganic phosphate transporter, PiT family
VEVESILTIFVLLVGFYMAWNIGANDVSNAMGTSVGSGALTLKRAVIIAALLEFCGAFFVGGNVSETIQQGLVDPDTFMTQPLILILGMCSALLGTGIWLQIASYFGWPVSTTHAIVGAILGFGGLIGGIDALNWNEITSVVISWIVSPVLSGLISYLIFNVLQRKILFAMNPIEATKQLVPYLVFAVFSTFTLSLIFNGLQNLDLSITFFSALTLAFLIGITAAGISYLFIKRLFLADQYALALAPSKNTPQTVISLEKAIKHLQRVRVSSRDDTHAKVSLLLDEINRLTQEVRKETSFSERTSEYRVVEKMFIPLQILSAGFVAFAHGANDVANAIGPVASVLDTIKYGAVMETSPIPLWLLAFGGCGIVIGLATWGWRVIETIGKKITELTPTRGFCAEFGAATTILLASKLGLPISTTHCLVGAVLGVGFARGIQAINLTMLRDIVLSWIVTIPASALMTIIVFFGLRAIFVS